MDEPHIPQDLRDEATPGKPFEIISATDIDGFLQWLFRDIPHRPEKLNQEKSAKVAAYLLRLSSAEKLIQSGNVGFNSEQEGKFRELALEMARTILVYGVQYSGIKPSSKMTALAFLRKHASTYFTQPYADPVREFVESFEIPPDAPKIAQRHLLSKSTSVSGDINPKLRNDLSERIYVAYHLASHRRENRKLLAELLEDIGIPHPTRKSRSKSGRVGIAAWDNDDISDTAKKFEKRFAKETRAESPEVLRQHREQLLLHWVRVYYGWRETVESLQKAKDWG